MDINATYVGRKFYKYVDGQLVMLRVMNDKDVNRIKCSVEGCKNVLRISKEEIDEDFLRLRPDGVIYFNTVTVGEVEDVIIMLYRAEDIDKKENVPYAVCRQNITDLLANTIKPDYNNLIVGLAISRDSLPENIDMNTILACDGINKSQAVCVYRTDTIQDILSLIKTKEYDNILSDLFVNHIAYKYKNDKAKYLKKDIVDGYCRNLKDLMESNEFGYEFCRGFNIFPVAFTISPKEINNSLTLAHTITMSNITMKKIASSFVVEYMHDIEFDNIQSKYVIIRDMANKTYIVAYTDNGNMEVPVSEIETPENIDKMSKIPGYAYNKDVQKAIKFNTSKYQQ